MRDTPWAPCLALVLFVSAGAACAQDLRMPTPPERRVYVALPPDADDISSQAFSSPLPVAMAERILTYTEVFEISDGTSGRQIQAFNIVLDQPDAAVRFRTLASVARLPGQLYAWCGLSTIDPAAAEHLIAQLRETRESVVVRMSDFSRPRPVSDVLDLARQLNACSRFRTERARVYRHFDKLRRPHPSSDSPGPFER